MEQLRGVLRGQTLSGLLILPNDGRVMCMKFIVIDVLIKEWEVFLKI